MATLQEHEQIDNDEPEPEHENELLKQISADKLSAQAPPDEHKES